MNIMEMSLRNIMWSLFICILIFFTTNAYSDEVLSLWLESVKSEYVIREPLKFIAIFENNSKDEVRLMPIEWLDTNDMDYMYFEIITPSGEKQFRYLQFQGWIGLINYEKFPGEPLMPGETREIFLYPNASSDYEPETGKEGAFHNITFPVQGEYRVKVVYSIPKIFKKIWRAEGGLKSNEISLIFRNPTDIEKEILDAYWEKGGARISFGDNDVGNVFDASSLERVIAKYPDHPMTKYAIFALGLEMRSHRHLDLRKSLDVFQKLQQKHPDFRYEEVQRFRASNYLRLGEKRKAVDICYEALASRPALKDHYKFMVTKILAEHGGEGLHRWQKARIRGSDRYYYIRKNE